MGISGGVCQKGKGIDLQVKQFVSLTILSELVRLRIESHRKYWVTLLLRE